MNRVKIFVLLATIVTLGGCATSAALHATGRFQRLSRKRRNLPPRVFVVE